MSQNSEEKTPKDIVRGLNDKDPDNWSEEEWNAYWIVQVENVLNAAKQ